MTSWISCPACGGRLIREREAMWKCKECNISITACEEDMRKCKNSHSKKS